MSASLLFAPGALAQTAPPTFDYMVLPGVARTPQGWMTTRPQLDGSYSDAQRREFNANWGNMAIGQAYALNMTTRPDGSALPGKGITGRGVVVGVIDSGIDATYANPANRAQGFSSIHPEFAGRLDTRSVKTGGDVTDITSAITDNDPGDGAGHGTHVAGTIGAAMNGVGMMGIAPGATILAVKGLGPGADTDNSIAYLNTLPEVKIINGSYGPIIKPGTTVWNTGDLSYEIKVVREALTQGKILVSAAGNDGKMPVYGNNAGGIGLFPYFSPTNAKSGVYNDGGRNYDTRDFDKLPGRIIAVANVGIDLTIAPSSNRCGVAAYWCISAPGGGDDGGTNNGLFSTYPRDHAGVQTRAPDGSTYTSIDGTSMAAPHVSGALAVLMEAYPTYTSKMIVNLMFATADDLGAPGIDAIYGQGFLRLDRALTPSPASATSGQVSVAQGERQIWTTPVDSTGVLNINNGAGPAASGLASALNAPLSASIPANAGELLIAGEASFSQVNLQSGVLTVDGVLNSPNVVVGRNASLQGMGDVNGNVTVNGRLAPDGELWVTGNVTMGTTGTLRTDIDGRDEIHGPGGYDTLVVLGAGNWFTAGGTYAVRFRGIEKDATNTFNPSIGDRFLSVMALDGAGVRGRFDRIMVEADPYGVTGMPVGARLDVFYYPDAVVAAITPESFANLAPAGIALNARQAAVGAALDKVRPAAGADMTLAQSLLFDPLYALTLGEIPQALTSISGPGYGAASAAVVNQTMQLSNAVQQRFDAVRGGFGQAQSAMTPTLGFTNDRTMQMAASLPAEMAYAADYPTKAPRAAGYETGWTAWGQAIGATGRVGSDGFGPGYNTRGGGIALGVDRVISPGVLVGVAGLYSHSVTNTDGGVRATADTYVGALYGSWTRGGWEFDALAGLGSTSLSSQRNFNLGGTLFSANSKTNGLNGLATAEFGYRVLMPIGGHAGYVKPLVGLSYGSFTRDAFNETGAGGFNLTVMGDTASRIMSKVGFATGIDIRTETMVVRPELRLAWGHDFRDTGSVTASLLGTTFSTLDAQPGRDAALIGLQIAAMGQGNWQVFGGYSGDLRSNATIHSGNIGAKVRF